MRFPVKPALRPCKAIFIAAAIWTVICCAFLWSYAVLTSGYQKSEVDEGVKQFLFGGDAFVNVGQLENIKIAEKTYPNGSKNLVPIAKEPDLVLNIGNISTKTPQVVGMDTDISLANGSLATNRKPSSLISSSKDIFNNILSSQTPPVQIPLDQSQFNQIDEINARVEKAVHNFPIELLENYVKGSIHINKTCANFPPFYDISFNNIYWQHLDTTNGTFYLYSGFYDSRNKSMSFVRVIGMIDKMDPTVKTYCQFWFDDLPSPIISKVFQYKYMWVKGWGNGRDGILQPYIMSCEVPRSSGKAVPDAVSIVEKICDTPRNIIKVTNNVNLLDNKKDFAVCVKAFDYLYSDISLRLVEWLETLFALGANKVFLYVLEAHPNVLKVMRYYEKLGMVDITPLTLPAEQTNLPSIIHKYLKAKVTHKRQNEVIPYNDCYYRNMYHYKYVVLLDIDEILMPRVATSWKDLMSTTLAELKPATKTSFCARNVYFFDEKNKNENCDNEIPCYLHFLRHTRRSSNYTKPGAYVKCFHSTDSVLALHNHFPFSCLGACKHYSFDTETAHLQHYRADCVGELKKVCPTIYKSHLVEDDSILRFKDRLLEVIPRVVKELGLS